ncbi:multidrug resistance-associated protein 1 [Achlya hypogyna]|uniref:Multidrug resistance-associated protein 1 n=1 Tax=Achlya hypogyna TaxID=1202772 RepID=A0A1V9Z4Y5_ACHHY|nr:multidrug resistance-associated protein 1 [Achlya hypogyna]
MAPSKYQSVSATVPETGVPAKHPLETVGIFSRLTYAWASGLMALGNERQLEASDIWPLQYASTCQVVAMQFLPKYRATKSIIKAWFSVFGCQALLIGFLQFIAMLCTLYGPIVLQQVVSAVESDTAVDYEGLCIAIGSLFLVKVAQATIQTQSDLQNEIMYVRATSALQDVLYKKALALNTKSRKTKSTGEVSNLFTADMWWCLTVSFTANQIWIIPLQIVALLYLLWQVLGYAMLLGIGVMLFTFFLNRVVATKQRDVWETLMEKEDARMKVVNEVFGAMQIIKLNAWEERYQQKILDLRNDEIKSLWHETILAALSSVLNNVAPVLLTTVSFGAYVLWLGETLTAAKVFTALSLFSMIKAPMMRLPNIIANWMQAYVSYGRFCDFLALDEKQPDVVTANVSANDVAVEIIGGSFGYDADKPLFPRVDLTIKRGEFVVVHGAVGEGKSSLCNILLGEMDKYAGSVAVGGRVAYFAQQPWIQNMTIRENILFGHPYDRKKYNAVLEACALTKDLTLFAAGDRTEIGSKGVNVSGGQKARISLARACYSDADIFLLDSPLSAVDAIVQNEIFTKCFLGLLRNKTILLVTHSPEIIASSYVDRTIEIKDGALLQSPLNVAKEDHPILVSPLKARAPTAFDDVVDTTAASAPTKLTYADTLVSPCIKSPFGHDVEPALFTPFDAKAPQTFDEELPTAGGKLVIEEERIEGRVSKEVFFSYFAAAGGWPVVVGLLAIQCLWQGLSILSDLYLGYWTGSALVLTPAEFHAAAEYNIIVYSLLALGSASMVVVRVLTVSLAGMRASRILFEGMTAGLLRAPMRFFDANPLGRVLNRFSGDMGQVDGRIPWSFSYFLSTLFVLIFSLGTTMVVIRGLGLFMLPLIYIYYYVGAKYVQPAREIERLSKTTKSPLMTHISESIDGAVLVRAFGDKQVRRFERRHQANVDANNQVLFAGDLAGQWFAFRIQLISASMLLVTTFSLVYLRGVLSPGLIGLVFNYALQITANLEGMVSIWSGLEMAMVAPERVAEYTNVEPEAPRLISGAVAKTWPTTGSLKFDNVSFRYKPTDPLVLKELNFEIRSGEKIGIVGRTGAGKSSLTMALFRINEVASGAMYMDGVDTKSVGLKTLRESMAIIPQNPILFKGTLRNYLDPFDDYSDEQLWDALTKVRMHARVSAEELKLESAIEENGENYSVGERQMLCMARALLRQSKIVVMDEATAAIDHETDQNLQRVIRDEFAASTVLTIAHRLDTVLDSDRVMVFDQGRCVQCDTPQNLIDAGDGIFFELCNEGGYLDRITSPKTTSSE